MKLQLFAVLLVVAGSYALPRANEVVEPSRMRNSVEYRIRTFIEGMITRIKNAGLDPLEVESREIEINPESLDLVVSAVVENVYFTGASDIRINTLEYSHFYKRLRLDVSLPEISLSVGDSSFEASILGNEIEGELKGSLTIKAIRVAGVGYVDVDIIGGISLQSVLLDCSIGKIEADLSVVAQGNDQSEFVNTLLNERIPNFLEENKDRINRALEDILSRILNFIWS